MRLLNISDIHFRAPECLTPALDPDAAFRSCLEEDVEALCVASGAVDAILVCGDIAFKGDPQEYEVAERWLLRLAEKCGCSPDEIYVVPGNHDIDRGISGRMQSIGNAQQAIASATENQRDSVFRRQLQDQQTRKDLFRPLEAYNDFAEKFACNVYPDQPFWTHCLQLEPNITLKLFGLTSTFISGLGDRDIEPGRLYLSSIQTVFSRERNVLNLVLCHHPPSWFLDERTVDDNINNRVQIQFFGHEHRQRCIPTNQYIRFLAGAVNPARDEPDWKPGYNLIDLSIQGEGSNRSIKIDAHVRGFQNAPEMFTAVHTHLREEVWTHHIRYPETPRVLPRTAIATLSQNTPSSIATPLKAPPSASHDLTTDVPEQESIVSTPSTKGLMYRFGKLTWSQKRGIAFKLGLITDEDMKIDGPERYARALKRAVEEKKLEALIREIELIEDQQ
ncbi:metallophosphoesterase [Herbaspirillum sp. AP02]|uniref:metallophosphoesterase n=1 Tax=unclassified Herbaspirillum TaxID=2624150 RepID=UPI0015D98D17|nr:MULTISPECIES: metallophosphoesterase [unclassified Herbaspirillum]MBG7622104.1 metallophosphoesterase [Herbaspirillum sp. AP02]NZD69123.1 metallophosphoesterase [Herbaspirillum sp. AP21]